jgi:uncharacterized protein
MNINDLPYFFLLASILFTLMKAFDEQAWKNAAPTFLFAVIAGFGTGRLGLLAIPSMAGLGLSLWLPTRTKNSTLKAISYLVALLLAIAMINFLLPGFKNLPVFEKLQFAKDSIPFTMYLNFDKALVGLAIFSFFLDAEQKKHLDHTTTRTALKTWLVLTVLMIPLAVFTHYAHFDPKFPSQTWIWALNNLFFVCLAEEAFFRGFIQGGLKRISPNNKVWSALGIGVAAILFGLQHYKGGVSYILFATLAGLFYGYVYEKTNRIEAAMLVHFGFNFTHFLFFSYPALIAR